jgi:DNA-binding transcriptional LysR family regulator
LRCAALAGLGIVFLATYFVGDDLRDGALVPLLTGVSRDSTKLYAAYPESWYLSPKVRAMIDWLLDEFSPEPDWGRDLPLSFE